MGLHRRYARILSDAPVVFIAGRKEKEEEIRKQLSVLFGSMMKALYKSEGAQLSIDILSTPQVREFIDSHASILDSSFAKVEMSVAMRRRLHRSDWIFSGIKTFHELNEAFPSLLDDNGVRKPFERFLNDVRSIDETYNANYLRAEYNFVSASAEMAAKWEGFMQDGDRYNLQYRTQKDDKVRPEHAALDGVTLPPSDPFWEEFYPPNGWNCRCTVVQVRKSKYPATPHDEAMRLGDQALQRDSKGIFRFNPGLERKTVPDYNPYTIRRCRDCDIAKGKTSLAKFIPDNHLCEACRFLRTCRNYETVKRVWEYVKELKNEVTVLNNVTASRLQTGSYYQTKKSFGRAIGHARDLAQAEMYEEIRKFLDDLVFLRYSPLGEGKDLSNIKDRRNIEAKRHRGVSGYNKYSLIQGDNSWIITMEVYKNRSETIYHIFKKE